VHEWGDWEVVSGSLSSNGEYADIMRECEKCHAQEQKKNASNWSDTIK
jgi:hypothetical protein